MEFKARVMEQAQLERSLARIAHEIIEKNNGAESICLLGIKRRGIHSVYGIHTCEQCDDCRHKPL